MNSASFWSSDEAVDLLSSMCWIRKPSTHLERLWTEIPPWMNFTCRFHDQRNFYNVCITKSEVASCWKLFLHKTELMLWFFFLTSSRGRIQLCVINPIFKITTFRMTIRVPSQRRAIPCRFQPSFCNDFNRFATLQRFYMPLQVLSSRRQNWGEQTVAVQTFFHVPHHSTQHYVAFDFWIDSRSGEALGHSLLP